MNIALGVTKYVPVSAGHVNKHLFANWFVGTVCPYCVYSSFPQSSSGYKQLQVRK